LDGADGGKASSKRVVIAGLSRLKDGVASAPPMPGNPSKMDFLKQMDARVKPARDG
jgi:hypothetical protein